MLHKLSGTIFIQVWADTFAHTLPLYFADYLLPLLRAAWHCSININLCVCVCVWWSISISVQYAATNWWYSSFLLQVDRLAGTMKEENLFRRRFSLCPTATSPPKIDPRVLTRNLSYGGDHDLYPLSPGIHSIPKCVEALAQSEQELWF